MKETELELRSRRLRYYMEEAEEAVLSFLTVLNRDLENREFGELLAAFGDEAKWALRDLWFILDDAMQEARGKSAGATEVETFGQLARDYLGAVEREMYALLDALTEESDDRFFVGLGRQAARKIRDLWVIVNSALRAREEYLSGERGGEGEPLD